MGQGRYVWTSSDEDLGAPKNSALMAQERETKMTEKERQQLLMGLGVWKLELKSELGRRAKKREMIFGRRARPGLLSEILNRLKRGG